MENVKKTLQGEEMMLAHVLQLMIVLARKDPVRLECAAVSVENVPV